MSYFSQEIAAHHPFSFSSVTTDSSFQVTVSILVLRKKWRKRVRRSIAAVTLVSIFIWLDSLVTVVETLLTVMLVIPVLVSLFR